MRNTQLFTNDYQVHSKSGNNKTYGTDRVLESYYMGNGESKSILIQDGDVKNNTIKAQHSPPSFHKYLTCYKVQ